MIPALLKGKLTEEQQNLEDLLTSAVFGLLQYVPAETGILKLLALGVPFDEKSEIVLPQTVSSQSYDFWPWLQCNDCHGAEPDVLITLIDHTGTTHRVLIEAKFRSGKSSYADSASAIPTDQLAREWDNLVCMCKPKGWVPHMVYITADFGIPLKDIESAAEEFQAKRPEAASKYPLNCYWLSWRHIPAAYGKSSDPMLKDILQLSRRYGFEFYSGVSTFALKSIPSWTFTQSTRPIVHFSFWPTPFICPTWSFNNE